MSPLRASGRDYKASVPAVESDDAAGAVTPFENVDTDEPKVPCACQHPSVVGVDLLEPVLPRTPEMDRVTGS